MTLRIEKKFVVAAPADAVWAFLTDPRKVASCLPGASITGEIDEKTYAGAMNMKVGPVNAQYRGKLRFERLDAEAREAEIVATGQETRGKGGADMRMNSRVVALGPDETEVHVTSDVQVAGVLAQLGGRMIQDVSDQMFEKFTGAMRRQLEPGIAAGAPLPSAGSSTPGPPPPGVGAELASARAGEAPPAASASAASPTPRSVAKPEPIPSPKASAVAVPLSLAEPHDDLPAAAPSGAAATGPAEREVAEVAAAAAPSLAAGGPGPIFAPAVADAGVAADAPVDRREPDQPPAPAVPAAATPPAAKAPAADRMRLGSPPAADPGREDVLDLGALGASAARGAATRMLRNPVFWIAAAVVVALLWLLLT